MISLVYVFLSILSDRHRKLEVHAPWPGCFIVEYFMHFFFTSGFFFQLPAQYPHIHISYGGDYRHISESKFFSRDHLHYTYMYYTSRIDLCDALQVTIHLSFITNRYSVLFVSLCHAHCYHIEINRSAGTEQESFPKEKAS